MEEKRGRAVGGKGVGGRKERGVQMCRREKKGEGEGSGGGKKREGVEVDGRGRDDGDEGRRGEWEMKERVE